MRQFITVIKSWLHFVLLVAIVHPVVSAEGPSTDPCDAGPCGKGAECKPMGSIAICVCPNDGKGDPFVACMPPEEEPGLGKPASSLSGMTASKDIVASVHHTRSAPAKVTTVKPSTTTEKATMSTSSTTESPLGTASTTRNPYVHVYQPTTERYSGNNGDHPESHRIPIISGGSNHDIFRQHNEHPSRPNYESDMRATSPGYHGSGALAGSSYELFNDKTSTDYGATGYPYRGSTGYYSGSGQGNRYDYDSRPIRPTTVGHQYADRYAHHGYHPSASGFPSPITEASRYPASSGSTYDVYNYNPVRNEIGSSGHDGAYSRIADPLGKYENCRVVNGIVVCADNRNSFPYNHPQYPSHHRGDVMSSTANYGFHSTRDRDHYSTYYPSRYSPSPTSHRPSFDYNYANRQGYPEHGSRPHLDSDYASSDRHPFFPQPQKVSPPNVLTITPPPNDNDNPRCQSMCGVNSVCRMVLDRPVCGCPEGHTGDPSLRCTPVYPERSQRREDGGNSCERHVDCKESEICAKNQCIDPCKHQDQIMTSSSMKIDSQLKASICGTNSECVVVGHTPLCKCNQGFYGNPYVACVA